MGWSPMTALASAREVEARGEERIADPLKPGLNAFGRRLVVILRAGFEEARAEHGVPMARMAAALGMSNRTFINSLGDAYDRFMRADRLFELLAREDILPDGPRLGIIRRLADECGVVAVDPGGCAIDEAPLGVQLGQIVGAVGHLGERAARAMADGSLGECEKRRIAAAARDARRELSELIEAMERGGA